MCSLASCAPGDIMLCGCLTPTRTVKAFLSGMELRPSLRVLSVRLSPRTEVLCRSSTVGKPALYRLALTSVVT